MKRIVIVMFVLCFGGQSLTGQCEHPDFDALMEFYEATDGENWQFNNGWKQGASGTNCSPCDWFGISCAGDDRVVAIFLENNNLSGTLPDLQIPRLFRMTLNDNSLSGELPDFSVLTNLDWLKLNGNSFEGEIPDFQNLPELKTLDLANNLLSGELVNFSNMNALEYLDLSENNLTGPIPLFNLCTAMEFLDLSINSINDTVPDFTDLRLLKTFNCRSAGLIGSFPKFSNCRQLQSIDVANNRLTGFVPDFSNHNALTIINADNNDLEGCYQDFETNFSIGISIGVSSSYNGNTRMPYLGDIRRADEEQVGAPCGIPGFVGYRAYIDENCKCVMEKCDDAHPELEALMEIYESTNGENWINNSGWKAAVEGYRCDPCNEDFGAFFGISCQNGRVTCIDMDGVVSCDFNGFGGNNLTGTWPKVGLLNLRLLILDDNNLEGDIPDVSGMPFLEELRATENNLNGELPKFYRNENLNTIRLSYNNIHGSIPNEKIAENIEFLTLAGNNLIGCYSDWLCDLGLFDATGNSGMPWYGDFEAFCSDSLVQESAPCIDDFSNEGLIRDCYCCELPDPQEQDHLCIQTIYPNPTESDLFISNLSEGTQCSVYDTKGQLVLRQRLQENKLDLSILNHGVYFLNYENLEYEHVTYKFVKL